MTQELGRILDVRLSPGYSPRSSAHDTTVGRSMTRVLQLINAGHGDEARYELVRLSMLVEHLQEIEGARPDLIPSFASRLVTHDVSAYIGAREEIAVAASLIRAGRQFAYEPPGGPDFRVTVVDGTVGLECTSTHVSTSLATPHIYARDDPEPRAKDVALQARECDSG